MTKPLNDAGFPVYQKEVNVFYDGYRIAQPKLEAEQFAFENVLGTELEQNRMRGPGGAPTRATTLPTNGAERKNFPIASGVLDYFPDALVALAEISKKGNDQHNPGTSLRWDRSKSKDESDTCIRHFLQRGTTDVDGMRHTAKAAWRLLAILQKEIEAEQNKNAKA